MSNKNNNISANENKKTHMRMGEERKNRTLIRLYPPKDMKKILVTNSAKYLRFSIYESLDRLGEKLASLENEGENGEIVNSAMKDLCKVKKAVQELEIALGWYSSSEKC